MGEFPSNRDKWYVNQNPVLRAYVGDELVYPLEDGGGGSDGGGRTDSYWSPRQQMSVAQDDHLTWSYSIKIILPAKKARNGVAEMPSTLAVGCDCRVFDVNDESRHIDFYNCVSILEKTNSYTSGGGGYYEITFASAESASFNPIPTSVSFEVLPPSKTRLADFLAREDNGEEEQR